MHDIMKKWGLLAKTMGIVLVLLAFKVIISFAGWEIFPMNALVTAFIGAVIFTLAIIFTGTLVDYKESEKIPSDLATSIRSLSHDFDVVPGVDKGIIRQGKNDVVSLLDMICENFRSNNWETGKVHGGIRKVNTDIHTLAGLNVAPPLLVKMRNELTAIDRISNRIATIAGTSFIPTAYAISEVAIGAVIVVLLFLKMDSLLQGLVLFGAIAVLAIGLLLLIKDMDNPFEVGAGTYADVNLDLLWDLQREMRNEQE
jgi:hypothetical protein